MATTPVGRREAGVIRIDDWTSALDVLSVGRYPSTDYFSGIND